MVSDPFDAFNVKTLQIAQPGRRGGAAWSARALTLREGMEHAD